MVELAERLGVSLLCFRSVDADFAIGLSEHLDRPLWWKPGDTTPLLILQR
jgi:hypothetical protein